MSNEKHPISELMDSSLQNLRTLVDADTVVGEAITTPDGTVIIPVSKVSFGFASGGSDIPTIKQAGQFGGGAGGGVSGAPVPFLVIKGGHVGLLQVNDSQRTADRIVTMAPEMVDKFAELFAKRDKNERQPRGEADGGESKG